MKTLVTATALTALLIAGSASAQIVGGQVGGQVGATLPTGAVTDTIGSTVRGAADLTQDTVRNTDDAIQEAEPPVDAEAQVGVQSDTRVEPSTAPSATAQTDAALQAGVMVHGSDGGMLGSIVDVTRDTAGRATAFTLQTTDGATRTVPATSVEVQGDAVVIPD